MPSSFAAGAVRVTAPPSYDVSTGGRRDRGLDAAPVDSEVVVSALEDSDLVLLERVDLTPRADRDLGAPEGDQPGTIEIEVEVPVDEDAVVLLERDGVYSWHLPTTPSRRTKSLDTGPRTAHFEIDVQPRSGDPAPADDRQDRGLLGNVVRGAVQALVFRFVAPPLVEKAVEKMESRVRTGLVHVVDRDPDTWRPFETLDELGLPTDRPVRVLLLVHGTFSSTIGAFGAMAADENGGGFLSTCIGAYDAVVGYDHRTLSLDPRQNAQDLLERLSTHTPGAELVIDVITHSRGGLTTRSFIEDVLPGSGWPARVDIAVFVASTHAGTRLASPERWSDLVDLYTNLAAVSARVLGTVPGAAPVAAVVAGVVKGIGAFVKYLVAYAAEGDDVPGLRAMMPGSDFVRELDRDQPGQPGPGTSWYVITSNFHVSLFDDHHNPPEFPRELAARLKEGFVDQIFEGDNDLVVDTSSMSAIAGEGSGFVRDGLALGENDRVYHNNYFTQLEVITALAGWLPLGMGAGGGPEDAEANGGPGGAFSSRGAMAEPPVAAMEQMAEPPADALAEPFTEPATESFQEPLLPDAAEAEVGAAAMSGRFHESSPAPAEEAPTRASVAAEMPADVVAKQDFEVRVRLSRRAIRATEGTAHQEADIVVVASRELTVQVVGKKNARISDPDTDVFDLPSGGGTSELVFTAQALAAGPVRVLAVVRQGTVPLATLTLDATAVSKKQAASLPLATTTSASTHPGTDAPELEDLACLDIFERELPNGSVVYQYSVRLDPGEPALTFESKPIKDRVRRIGKILDSVTKVWQGNEADPRERERKLQDIGAKMFDELFPEDMQAHLWNNRAKVHDLLLYADEPFVPWELVHLKPPTGPRQQKPRFLAQAGLVRWQHGSFPGSAIRIRTGKARSLCPAYLDPRFTLSGPVEEHAFLKSRFGARKVTATPDGVRDLLRSGRFDLLHFSGHGAADPDDILDAKVLLRGLKRGDTVEPQYLGATTVSENAAWAALGEPGPVVVLNACQVGQAGDLLTTVGGFAKAFLDAGASAFVSCLWSVRQEPSRMFVEKLYEELLAGSQISVASARAREAARKGGDASWLAFVVYARPDAVLSTG